MTWIYVKLHERKLEMKSETENGGADELSSRFRNMSNQLCFYFGHFFSRRHSKKSRCTVPYSEKLLKSTQIQL